MQELGGSGFVNGLHTPNCSQEYHELAGAVAAMRAKNKAKVA